MRKLLAAFVAIASLTAPVAAFADRGGRGHGGWRHSGGWHHRPYHGHRHWHARPRVFVGYGAPLWWGPPVYGYWYGWGAAYGPWGWGPPAVVRERVIEREAPVYVEREPAESAPVADEAEVRPATWYFCRSENAYYPDVERCPEAWIPVPPRSE